MSGRSGVLGFVDGRCSGFSIFLTYIPKDCSSLVDSRCVYRKFLLESSTILCQLCSSLLGINCTSLVRGTSPHSCNPQHPGFDACKPNPLHQTHSRPTLFAAPCLGSRTLDEEAITSNVRRIALRRSTVSRRGSLSCLIGITKGGGRACLARSLVFDCEGRWIFFVPSLLLNEGSIDFTATMGFFLDSSCRTFCCGCCGCCSFCSAAARALILR
jgi:hypothetical protein